MNRQQRRTLQKKFKGQNVLMNPGSEQGDHANAKWCWMHKLNLDNIDRPTERDKKLIASIEFKPFKAYDKAGNLIMGRKCPRCGNTIMVENPLITASKQSILEVPQGNEYADLHLSNG